MRTRRPATCLNAVAEKRMETIEPSTKRAVMPPPGANWVTADAVAGTASETSRSPPTAVARLSMCRAYGHAAARGMGNFP